MAAPAASLNAWHPERLRLRPVRLVAAWAASALALLLAAGLLPGAEVRGVGGAVAVAAIVGVLNAILPPIVAALRLPYTVAIGFLLVLALDAAILLVAEHVAPDQLHVAGFGSALAVALVASAVSTGIGVVVGIDDDDAYTLRVARRVARRIGSPVASDAPGILFLEIDGLALPVLRRAIRDGTTPNMARWVAAGTHALVGWETDLSSQTGASQAGILLGDNEDVPAFRWVEKASGKLVTCSNPDDCAAIERQRATGAGLLVDGGTSRGNLLMRAGMCVFIRDLIAFSVLQDMFRGVPAVYATFASYDEVAHHSGLERPDTVEALRKLDQRFGMIERARRYSPRPYEIVVLSDHGQTQGATFRQRNGYGLDDLVERSLSRGSVDAVEAGDENATGVGRAFDEATGRTGKTGEGERKRVGDRDAVVLGSGNLGLIYLMQSPRRLTLEEINESHPALLPALCEHPHIAFMLVRSAVDGPVALGARGSQRLDDRAVTGIDPLAGFSPNARDHLHRADGFAHVADIVVNSFYDPVTEEGCAFEELICFHGGMGGPQTEPFILHPVALPVPSEPLVGAEAVHAVLRDWRTAVSERPGPRGLAPVLNA
jgi:uncharacterized membrane protein YvlD (DUF360 family)